MNRRKVKRKIYLNVFGLKLLQEFKNVKDFTKFSTVFVKLSILKTVLSVFESFYFSFHKTWTLTFNLQSKFEFQRFTYSQNSFFFSFMNLNFEIKQVWSQNSLFRHLKLQYLKLNWTLFEFENVKLSICLKVWAEKLI